MILERCPHGVIVGVEYLARDVCPDCHDEHAQAVVDELVSAPFLGNVPRLAPRSVR